MSEIALIDGATVSAIVAALAAIIKYGGQFVAIFARQEVYQKQTVERLQEMGKSMNSLEMLMRNHIDNCDSFSPPEPAQKNGR